MKVAIVHYHFRRGGVTRVVENAILALGDRVEVTVFSGEAIPDGGAALWDAVVVPGLGYLESGSPEDVNHLSESLMAAARAAFGPNGPDLWHFHNHSLGKNVCLPAVIDRLAGDGARVLLQIHDFAEDGRPENYRRQREFSRETGWFPDSSQIHYAVLNTRDESFLARSGLDPSRLHLLPNPVSALPVESDPASRPFAEDKRFLLYPTRGIRRKNIGELVLLAALAGDRFEFATTLGPENPEWKPIHDRWKTFAESHGLPVRLALGEDPQYRFEELIGWSDALVTTSVAEGFGLAFLEPWLAGKSVVGRDLPEITADFTAHGLDTGALYQQILVPLDWIGEEPFRKRLQTALEKSYRDYGRKLPDEAVDRAFEAAVIDGEVDFARLDEPFQQAAIVRMIEEGDTWKADRLEAGPEELVERNAGIVSTHYSLDAYGDRLDAIYREVVAAETGAPEHLDGDKLLDAFLDPARFFLLRS